MQVGNFNFDIQDLSGAKECRALWHNFYGSKNAIIYVVDSTDTARLDESKDELHRALAYEENKGRPLLIYANKQDLYGATSITELTTRLDLAKITDREHHIQGCSAAII